MKSLQNILLRNKATSIIYLFLAIAGTLASAYFILVATLYLCLISSAYYAGSKISGVGMNVAYNWSIKWALFVISLVFVGTYMQEAFIVTMLTLILINTTINPAIFIKTQEITT